MVTETQEHRRHAVQIVSSLPDDVEDALLVLRAAERLLKGFVDEPASKSNVPIRLVSTVGED